MNSAACNRGGQWRAELIKIVKEPMLWLLLICLGKVFIILANPAVILDDMRQFGPALSAVIGGHEYLLKQPQIAYYASVIPVGYRILVGTLQAFTGMGLPALMKTLALLSSLITVVGIWQVSKTLFSSFSTQRFFSFFALLNLMMTAQMLSGTPRDLGTAGLVWATFFIGKKQWLSFFLVLFLLAGLYPVFALLAFLSLAFLFGFFRDDQRFAPPWISLASLKKIILILISLAVMWSGLKLLGPDLSAGNVGPVLHVFRLDRFGIVPGDEMGWRELFEEMLGGGRFKLVHWPWKDPLRWIILGITSITWMAIARHNTNAGSSLSSTYSVPSKSFDASLQWKPFALSFASACLALYFLSALLAYRLYAPSRYSGILWIFVAAGLETFFILGIQRDKRVQNLLLAASLFVCFIAVPVGVVQLSSHGLQALDQLKLDPSTTNILVVGRGKKNTKTQEFANSLPLMLSWRSLYLRELDRGFHLEILSQNHDLRTLYSSLNHRILAGEHSDLLTAALRSSEVSHLMVDSEDSSLLNFEKTCAHPVQISVNQKAFVVPLNCFDSPLSRPN